MAGKPLRVFLSRFMLVIREFRLSHTSTRYLAGSAFSLMGVSATQSFSLHRVHNSLAWPPSSTSGFPSQSGRVRWDIIYPIPIVRPSLAFQKHFSSCSFFLSRKISASLYMYEKIFLTDSLLPRSSIPEILRLSSTQWK